MNVFNEFQRQGLVSKYKMALQDLLMKVASKEETLESEIEFGTFTWAVKILSRYDLNATIAQVLLSLSNIFNFVAIIILLKKILHKGKCYHKFFVKAFKRTTVVSKVICNIEFYLIFGVQMTHEDFSKYPRLSYLLCEIISQYSFISLIKLRKFGTNIYWLFF